MCEAYTLTDWKLLNCAESLNTGKLSTEMPNVGLLAETIKQIVSTELEKLSTNAINSIQNRIAPTIKTLTHNYNQIIDHIAKLEEKLSSCTTRRN